jgi:hypothetical protein
MATDQANRDPFVAAIEAKIAAWKNVLESYNAAVSLDGPLGAPDAPQAHNGGVARSNAQAIPLDLPVGVFRDKSLREAIEILLAAGRRKQTNKEIAIGLQNGGIPTTSVNFEATVSTALARMKDDGTVLRFPDGWDLAASYPDSLRGRLEKDTKPRKRRNGKKPRPAAKTAKKPSSAAGEPLDKTALMHQFIASRPQGTSVDDVVQWFRASGAECSPDYVRVVTKRLRAKNRIEIRDGRFFPAVG